MTKSELIQELVKNLSYVTGECPVYILLLGEKVEIENVSYSFENGEGSIVIVP